MKQTLYLIRHCQATGQAPDAPLTPTGAQQAVALAAALAPFAIEQIVSSPYMRATQSVTPLAELLDLPIRTDARLVERVLSGAPIDDWVNALRATFDDVELAFPGGETSRAASERAVAAINEALAHGARVLAIASHGNLLSLVLRHFDPALGFAEWQAMRNPDVYRVALGDGSAPQVQHISFGED
jgi:2,3-bisphosphoglycerate-dependent phosphoglycerate mutase